MIFLDQYFLVKRTPRTWVQTESCIAENNCHVKWIALFSSWMCWYLNLPADTTGNVLWFFQEVLFPKKLSFLSTVLLLYLIIAKWLRSTRVPKGRVCNRVPKALQQCMPLRQGEGFAFTQTLQTKGRALKPRHGEWLTPRHTTSQWQIWE